MLGELQTSLDEYLQEWQAVTDGRSNTGFFGSLKATAVGWKSVDLQDFDRRFADLRTHADQIHLAWLNERWVALFHLKDSVLPGGITIVKLMQRRPASTDATGLDHVDFWFDAKRFDAKQVLSDEQDIRWTEEFNGDVCKWLSVWFDGTEAKIRSDTVLDVAIKEMELVKLKVL